MGTDGENNSSVFVGPILYLMLLTFLGGCNNDMFMTITMRLDSNLI